MKRYLSYLPALILLAGAVLRVTGTGAAALWFDESVTLARAQHPFWQVLTQSNSDQSGSLLLDLLVRPLVAISPSVWMLRLPSLLAALGSLALVWVLMRRLGFNLAQQAIASALIAFMPGLLWMAQDARSYSLLTFFFLLAVWALLERRWWIWLLSIIAMEYCHYTAVPMIGTLFILALLLHRQEYKRILLLGCLIAIAYIPQLLMMKVNGWDTALFISGKFTPVPAFSIGWMAYANMLAFWIGSVGNPYYLVLFFVLLLATLPLILFGKVIQERGLLFILFILPVMLIALASFIVNIYLYRTLMPLVLFFLLWLGWELGRPSPQFYRSLILILWASFTLYGVNQWDPGRRGGYMDQAADQIRQAWQPGDVLNYGTFTVGLPMNYYLGDLPHQIIHVTENGFLSPPGNVSLMDDYIPPSYEIKRVWLIFPNDVLLSAAERSTLDAMTMGMQPMMELHFPQTSAWLVYLVVIQ